MKLAHTVPSKQYISLGLLFIVHQGGTASDLLGSRSLSVYIPQAAPSAVTGHDQGQCVSSRLKNESKHLHAVPKAQVVLITLADVPHLLLPARNFPQTYLANSLQLPCGYIFRKTAGFAIIRGMEANGATFAGLGQGPAHTGLSTHLLRNK